MGQSMKITDEEIKKQIIWVRALLEADEQEALKPSSNAASQLLREINLRQELLEARHLLRLCDCDGTKTRGEQLAGCDLIEVHRAKWDGG